MGKAVLLKVKTNQDVIFHTARYLSEVYILAQKGNTPKLDFVFFTAGYVAPKIVLNKYLLNKYFHK